MQVGERPSLTSLTETKGESTEPGSRPYTLPAVHKQHPGEENGTAGVEAGSVSRKRPRNNRDQCSRENAEKVDSAPREDVEDSHTSRFRSERREDAENLEASRASSSTRDIDTKMEDMMGKITVFIQELRKEVEGLRNMNTAILSTLKTRGEESRMNNAMDEMYKIGKFHIYKLKRCLRLGGWIGHIHADVVQSLILYL
mmetsp:Transcript_24557/g.39585  ORF Transcript_24557/g.39585 Transcript_24557/m.39585 type:complete len:199 (-) Transcript_24557:628-1224(-)